MTIKELNDILREIASEIRRRAPGGRIRRTVSTDLRGDALLRAVREKIVSDPEHHEQREYAVKTACGTKYCVAGWAIALAYGEAVFAWEPVREVSYEPGRESFESIGATEFAIGAVTPGGDYRHVESFAMDLLDVDDDMATRLFKDDSTRDEVLAAIDEWLEL